MKPNILFIANNNIGTGLSGGDRIFLELARYWQPLADITVVGSEEVENLLIRYQLKVTFLKTDTIDTSPLLIHQLRRIVKGLYFFIKYRRFISSQQYIYTVSDFYPDLLFGPIAKLLNHRIKWIAGYYLVVPPPWLNKTYNPLYYFSQLPSRFLVNLFANIVYLTSKPDQKFFPGKKIVIVQGGVDIPQQIIKTKKIFDAVFIGRLHPQKGVLELIDIWNIVTQKLPQAKLAIIGNGPLESQVIKKIKRFKLANNIKLFGFLDGTPKNKVIQQSKIVVHPAVFDSGGMAAAEAMVFGLPGVSFDLESLKTYYPIGMIKTPCFNLKKFADNIINLLTRPNLYKRNSIRASELIYNHWLWPKKSTNIFFQTFNLQYKK